MRLTKKVVKKFYIPNDSDGAWVNIRHLKINEVKKIQGKVNNMSFTSDLQGNGETKLDLNPYSVSTMMAHACLEDWGGMKDAMGRELKFESANIDKAGEFIVLVEEDGKEVEFDFYSWIDKCRNELAEEVKAELVVAEEN